MLPTVRYCAGYGWHVGRPLVWAGLTALGIPLAFIAVAIESSGAIHIRMPIALVMPALFALAGYRRCGFIGSPALQQRELVRTDVAARRR